MSDHNFWTVDTTAYLRQMSQQDLRQEVYALHYQAAPRRNEESILTTISLRFPVAVAVYYLDDQKANLQLMADALNACEGIANPSAIPAALKALYEIAAYKDKGASHHLAKTGSYSKFDEPAAVKIARETIDLLRGGE